MSDKNELALKEQAALAQVDFGTGEQYAPVIEADERRLPYLILLQAGTPMVKDPEHKVPGAEAGQFFNSSNKELYSGEEGVIFIPVVKDRFFIERTPDDAAKFVARWDTSHPMIVKAVAAGRNKDNDFINPENGNILTDTRYFYGLILNEENPEQSEPVIIPFKKSKIQAFVSITDAVDKFKPARAAKAAGKPWPWFAYQFRLKSFYCSDNDGYYNVEAEPANGRLGDSLNLPDESPVILELGKALFDAVLTGDKTADYDGEGAAERPEVVDENPPF